MSQSNSPLPEDPSRESYASKRWNSPWRLLLILVATIFTIELLLMTALHFLKIPGIIEIIIDSLVLVVLLMPVLLKTVIHPMRSRIDALAQAELSLRKAQNELERRVHERTVALTLANETLQHEIEERTRMQDELQRLATTDTLTGLRNRRAFEDFTELEINSAMRHGNSLSLIMFDIDYFKRINDTFGHHVGDDVLVQVAAVIGKRIRASEILARWGGEEFIILLPQTDIENAMHLAEELRERLQAHVFQQVGTVTASFGVSRFTVGDNMDSLLQRADDALYRAKAKGRNCVEYGDAPLT